jgi:hypothetical protein
MAPLAGCRWVRRITTTVASAADRDVREMDMAQTWVPVASAPSAVREAAAMHDLGTRFVEYTVKASRMGATLTKGIFALLVTVFCLWISITAAFQHSVWVAVLTGLLGFGGVMWIIEIAWALSAAGDSVYLFDSGFVHLSRGGIARVFPWAQISVFRHIVQTVRHGRVTGTDYTYTVRRPDGESVVLDNNMYWEIAELGSMIEREVFQAQLPRSIEAVRAGQSVAFGQFEVGPHGIRNGQDIVPWGEVEQVVLEKGYVGVRTSGRRRTPKYDIATVPNIFVFAKLAESLKHA